MQRAVKRMPNAHAPMHSSLQVLGLQPGYGIPTTRLQAPTTGGEERLFTHDNDVQVFGVIEKRCGLYVMPYVGLIFNNSV